MFSYDKLWKLLVDKHMNKVELRRYSGHYSSNISENRKKSKYQYECLRKNMQCFTV